MGVGIDLWRIRIGTFSQPARPKSTLSTLKLKYVSLCIRVFLFFLLAAQCVETNPGPTRQQQRAASTSASTSAADLASGTDSASVRQSRRETLNRSVTDRPTPETPPKSPANQQSQRSINAWFGNQQQPQSQEVRTNTQNTQNAQNVQKSVQHKQRDKQQTKQIQNDDIRDLKEIMLSVKSTVDSVESRLNNFEDAINEIKESNRNLVESNTFLTESVSTLNEKVSQLEKDLKASEERRENLEAQSRRDNLRFYGLDETRNETWEETEDKVRQYIREDLNVQSDISIERAHRIRGTDTPRPVIVKFSFFKEREKVIKAYREKKRDWNEHQNADNARSNIHVSEDFPSRVMRARNNMRRFLRKALDEGKRAFFKFDKLIIDREAYTYDDELDDIIKVR